jgi:hypothetical protein
MIRRQLLLAALCVALGAAPAAAHWDILWDDKPPRLARAQADRVDALLRRAEAVYRALPAEAETLPAIRLGGAYLRHGRCRDAERWMRATRNMRKWSLYGYVQPTLVTPDRACAGRMVAFLADPERRLAGGRTASDLYLAGALWRRLGEEERGRKAIEEGERLLSAAERAEARPEPGSCQGHLCVTPAWRTRLDGLRAYHGTPLYAPELRRLAGRALAEHEDHKPTRADEPSDPASETVLDDLALEAVREGVDDAAERIARRDPALAARRLAQARMAVLFEEHRFAEGANLGMEARESRGDIRGAVAVDPGAFHPHRLHLREWAWRWSDLLADLALAHLKRGDAAAAREAIAALRAQAGPRPAPEVVANLGRALGIEAMIDHPDAPVATLAPRLAGQDRFAREAAYSEVAAHQARLGRWGEYDRAAAPLRGTVDHGFLLAELPCLARGHRAGSLRQALRRAQAGAGGAEPALGGAEIEDGFWCLFEAGRIDAAIEVAGWADRPVRRSSSLAPGKREPGRRAGMLARAANSEHLAGGDRTRRRLADLAWAEVEALGLWADEDVTGPLAGAYERLGDRRRVDRILARAPDAAARFEILLSLVEDYRPDPPQLERKYGFARNA